MTSQTHRIEVDGRDERSNQADKLRMLSLFTGRADTHAVQWVRAQTAGYAPVRRPLDLRELDRHLAGDITAGVYLIGADQRCSVLCLDLDVRRAALDHAHGDRERTHALRQLVHAEGLRLRDALRRLGLDPLLEDSGSKGRHLWCFLAEPMDAVRVHRAAQALAQRLLPTDPRLHLEGFPKQGRVKPGGLGNLVKLPLGVHRVSERRCPLLDEDGRPVDDPWAVLREVRRTGLPEVAAARSPEPESPRGKPPSTAAAAKDWTLADFDRSPTVGPVLEGCAVLHRVVQRILDTRRVQRAETIVLNHSLGHLEDGAKAANYLYDQVADFPEQERIKAVRRGSPVSCRSIRSRLKADSDAVGCACRFPQEGGRYSNPLRHLEGVQARPQATGGIQELLRRYARQVELRQDAQRQEDALRHQVLACMEGLPEPTVQVPGGRWRVTRDKGDPVLTWESE